MKTLHQQFADIATQYGRVAEAHRQLADASRIAGRHEDEQHHHERAVAGWQWAYHYSCLSMEHEREATTERDMTTSERLHHGPHH